MTQLPLENTTIIPPPKKLSRGYYCFCYAPENPFNINPALVSYTSTEAEVPDEYATEKLGYDMLGDIESGEGNICDGSDYNSGAKNGMSYDTYTLTYVIDTQHRDKMYSWFCEPTDGSKEILEGNNIVYFSGTGWEWGIIKYNKM